MVSLASRGLVESSESLECKDLSVYPSRLVFADNLSQNTFCNYIFAQFSSLLKVGLLIISSLINQYLCQIRITWLSYCVCIRTNRGVGQLRTATQSESSQVPIFTSPSPYSPNYTTIPLFSNILLFIPNFTLLCITSCEHLVA